MDSGHKIRGKTIFKKSKQNTYKEKASTVGKEKKEERIMVSLL